MRVDRRFNGNLSFSEDIIREEISRIAERLKNNEVPAERIGFEKNMMWGYKFSLVLVGYAMGVKVKKLAKEFNKFMHDALTEWDGGVMSQMLDVASLCVLFHTRKEIVEGIEKIINNKLDYFTQEYEEEEEPFYYWLIDYLLQAAKGESCKAFTKDKMKMPFYTKLCEAVSDRYDIESALKTYVSKWWKTPRFKHFIDNFTNDSASLWCFEAAALAALFNIKTDVFKDSSRVPVDLVVYYKRHRWKRFLGWW